MEKHCSKCKKLLNFILFHKRVSRKDGRRSACIECERKDAKQYRAEHLEEIRNKGRENSAQYRKDNPEKHQEWYQRTIVERRKYGEKRYRKNPEKEAEHNKKNYTKHRTKRLVYRKKYYTSHFELIQEYNKKNKHKKDKWISDNPEKMKEYIKRSNKKRVSTPKGKLNVRIGRLIYHSLRGAKEGKSWCELVPYSLIQLKRHIEKQFKEGMSWEAYMRGEIHIDHIIPVSVFTFSRPDDIQFQTCWALKNLRPLWKADNLKKSAKLLEPFQQYLL